MTNQQNEAKLSWLLTMASIAIVIGGLYFAKGVLLPFILSVLISFLLTPICNWLEKRRIGRAASVLVAVTLTFSILTTITWIAVTQMSDLARNMAQYQSNIEVKLRSVKSYVGTTLKGMKKTTDTLEESMGSEVVSSQAGGTSMNPYAVKVIPSPPSPLDYFGNIFGPLLEGIVEAGIILVLVLFFLFRREDLRDRFIRLVGQGQVTGTTDALADATSRVSRYLLVQLCINIGFGTIVAIGLYFIGIPNALLWGLLTTVLKFIPYIGVWIAAAAPTAVGFAIGDGWGAPILAFGLFAVLEFMVGNFLEPILFGKHTGVSAVAILIAAVFWAWLWGGVGLLLATPLTVCLLVIGKHVPQLGFLDILLGDEPVFEPKLRVYQRLLAGDQEEAIELISDIRKTQTLAEVSDTVLIPALGMAQRERYRGEIDAFRLEFIVRSMKGVVEEIGETLDAEKASANETVEAPETEPVDPTVPSPENWKTARTALCFPAAGEADEVAALMLSQVAQNAGFLSRTVPFQAEPSDIVKILQEAKSDLLCIAALAPAAVTHARSLSRLLHLHAPHTRIVIGLLGFQGQLAAAEARLGTGPMIEVYTSIQEIETQLKLIAEPELALVEKPAPALSTTLPLEPISALT